MQKDLKIGIILGLVLAAVAALWLSTRPSLSTKARMLNSRIEHPRLPVITSSPDTSAQHDDFNTLSSETTTTYKAQDTRREQQDTRLHTVREGETLSDISYRYYGSANKWQKIFNANRGKIKDASRLKPGTKLIIPE